MMGEIIEDAEHIEGDIPSLPGLGILPIRTGITGDKRVNQCSFTFLDASDQCTGYEIHMGRSVSDSESPLCHVDGEPDGYYLNERTWGTYIHGIFDNPVVINRILSLVDREIDADRSYREYKEKNYDKLADLIRDSVDLDAIYRSMTIGE